MEFSSPRILSNVFTGVVVSQITSNSPLLRRGGTIGARSTRPCAHLVSLLRADLRLSPKSVRPHPRACGYSVATIRTLPPQPTPLTVAPPLAVGPRSVFLKLAPPMKVAPQPVCLVVASFFGAKYARSFFTLVFLHQFISLVFWFPPFTFYHLFLSSKVELISLQTPKF